MKNSKRIIFYLSVTVSAIVLFGIKVDLPADSEFRFLIESIIGGGTLTLILTILNWIIKNIDDLWFKLLNLNPFKKNQIIRVSIAYVFRIKVNGKYLLIKNSHIPNQFQPVGGVFKFFKGADAVFQQLEVMDDNTNCIPKKFDQKNDLRIRIRRKNLNKFIRWFNEKSQREVSVQREFYEELINETTFLNKGEFPYIDYKYLHTNKLKVKFSKPFQMNEVLIHEVYELIPLEVKESSGKVINQEKILEDKLEEWEANTDYTGSVIWADDDLILRQGAPEKIKIAEHTPNIIEKNFY